MCKTLDLTLLQHVTTAPYTLMLVGFHIYFNLDAKIEDHIETFPINASNDKRALKEAKTLLENGGVADRHRQSVGYLIAKPNKKEQPRVVATRYLLFKKIMVSGTPQNAGYGSFFARSNEEADQIFNDVPVEYRNILYSPDGIVRNKTS